MYKKVELNIDALVEEFNAGGMFKLRRHAKMYNDNGDTTECIRHSVAEIGAMSMGWCQGVYGPLPGRRPTLLAIFEYTGMYDGCLIFPIHEDGTAYLTECYDDVHDQEYCIWADKLGWGYDEMMEYVENDDLISLTRD